MPEESSEVKVDQEVFVAQKGAFCTAGSVSQDFALSANWKNWRNETPRNDTARIRERVDAGAESRYYAVDRRNRKWTGPLSTEWVFNYPDQTCFFWTVPPELTRLGSAGRLGVESRWGDVPLVDFQSRDVGAYNAVTAFLADQRVTLPPSAALAGVFARVDRDRGVWKAPANVGLASVLGPTRKLTDAEQDDLNVDAVSGKSINAIRSFTGRGTLAWGARTLRGNDNEWRYISVRRLFITIEESIRNASAFAVFEGNDAATWVKVKAMIEAYLYGLWEQGALAGARPEQSYFVNVGLGKTMTTQDVLEGRLIVEVGVAAVRPAEFIVLKFSHKLQES